MPRFPRPGKSKTTGTSEDIKQIFARKLGDKTDNQRAGGQALTPLKFYGNAVRYLRENPKEVRKAFSNPHKHVAGCLFWFCSPDKRTHSFGDFSIGCPMMIATSTRYIAWTKSFTVKVINAGLPKCVDSLDDKHIGLLANLQMEMDTTFRDKHWREQHFHDMVSHWPGDRVEEEECEWT